MGSAKVNTYLLIEENHEVFQFLNSPGHCCDLAIFSVEITFKFHK